MSEAATLTTEITAAPTALSTLLRKRDSGGPNLSTPRGRADAAGLLSSHNKELSAALSDAACFDLGYRTRIRITGEDRLRWLNGMVSNAIQTLPEGHGNYNFILNAQGRIQGDAISIAGPAIFCSTPTAPRPRACSPTSTTSSLWMTWSFNR